MGETTDPVIIATVVIVSMALNFFRAYRSECTVMRLREQVAPTAMVLRNGDWIGHCDPRLFHAGRRRRLRKLDEIPFDSIAAAFRSSSKENKAV
jgi:hypothetical protein